MRYPFEELENLSKEILAVRLTKFYQELKQDDGKEYSRSPHVAIRAGINRYLTSERIGKTFSIISDPIFKPTVDGQPADQNTTVDGIFCYMQTTSVFL